MQCGRAPHKNSIAVELSFCKSQNFQVQGCCIDRDRRVFVSRHQRGLWLCTTSVLSGGDILQRQRDSKNRASVSTLCEIKQIIYKLLYLWLQYWTVKINHLFTYTPIWGMIQFEWKSSSACKRTPSTSCLPCLMRISVNFYPPVLSVFLRTDAGSRVRSAQTLT